MAIPQPMQLFLIKSRMNGLYLDVEGARGDPRTRILLWTRHGNDNQQWYLDPSTGTIRSKINNMCIDIESDKLATNIYQQGDPNQQWELNGQQIRNRIYPNKVLDVIGRNMQPGAHIGSYDFNGQDNQSWEYEIIGGYAPPPGQGPQMGASTGYPGGQPGQYPPQQPYGAQQGYPAQQPGYPPQQPGYPTQQPVYPGQQPGYPVQQPGYPGPQPGYPAQQTGYPSQQPATAVPRKEFQILSEMNQKAIDIERGNTAAGTKICMYNAQAQACKNQLWYTDPQGFIRSALNDMVFYAAEQGHPLTMVPYTGDLLQQWKMEGNKLLNGQGACMDIRGASHSNGAELCAYKYNNASNQHWNIHYV